MGLRRRLERIRREERGITLIELLITAVILNVVLFAILGLLEMSARAVPKDLARAAAIQESQSGLYRMTRELRQAHGIVSAGTDALTVDVFVGGVSTRVTYDCTETVSSFRRCTRRVVAPAPASARVLVIDRLVNHVKPDRPVFRYYQGLLEVAPADAPTAARQVKVTLIVPGRGEERAEGGYQHEIVLADGLFMRNLPDLPDA